MMKKNFYHKLTLWILSIIFCGCSPAPNPNSNATRDPDNSCEFVTRSEKFSDLPHSWGISLPVLFELHHTVPEEYISFFHESAEMWNTALDAKFIIIQNDINQKRVLSVNSMESDKKNVIYWLSRSEIPVTDENNSYTRSLALTRKSGVKLVNSYVQLINTDIIIVEDTVNTLINTNLQYLNPRGIRAFNENLIRNTISHEFGHALGLADNPNSPLMYIKSNMITDLVRQPVNEEDINNLSCIYDLDYLRRTSPLEQPVSI